MAISVNELSFAKPRPEAVTHPVTIADGARSPYPGRYTLPMILRRVDRMMTVTDAELARLVLLCMERLKLVAEPSGVLGLAGARRDRREGRAIGRRIGVVISGGNIDLAQLPHLARLAETTA